MASLHPVPPSPDLTFHLHDLLTSLSLLLQAPTAPPKPSSSSSRPTPGKRTPLRARVLAKLADPTLPRKTHRPSASVPSDFIDSKRDKQRIKHSAFVNRIQKSSSSSPRTSTATSSTGTSSSAAKRRRPNKKLVATLESLADALPELTGDESRVEGQDGKVRHKSLRSRPGALKRKERVVKGEMARFGASLAELSRTREEPLVVQQQQQPDKDGGDKAEAAPGQVGTTNRWAALRGFISATMEQNPAFVNKA